MLREMINQSIDQSIDRSLNQSTLRFHGVLVGVSRDAIGFDVNILLDSRIGGVLSFQKIQLKLMDPRPYCKITEACRNLSRY